MTNKSLSKRVRILEGTIIVMLLCIVGITVSNKISSKASTANMYRYAKEETLLKEKASSSSKTVQVINKGTKLKYISTETTNDGNIYDKVEIVGSNSSENESVGYVLRRHTDTKK